MHSKQQHNDSTPAWVLEMTALTDALIDQGITSGLALMARTPGLYANQADPRDLYALAFRRALTAGIPLSATVGEVLNRLTERAASMDSIVDTREVM